MLNQKLVCSLLIACPWAEWPWYLLVLNTLSERFAPADTPCHRPTCRAQLNTKGPGKQRCIECVSGAAKAEAKSKEARDEEKRKEIQKLKDEVKRAETSGDVAAKLAAAARLSAAEAELVTGLKPKSGRGRGRGRGRAGRGGSWRSRSRGRGR